MGICLLQTVNLKGRRLADLSFKKHSIHRFYQIKNMIRYVLAFDQIRQVRCMYTQSKLRLYFTNFSWVPVGFQLLSMTLDSFHLVLRLLLVS